MSYSAKLHIATAALGLGVACAFYGFSRVQAEAQTGKISTFSFVLLFGGSVIGIAAGISQIYFRSRIKHSKSAEQMKVEALANAGKRRKTKKQKI